ncbi:MAG: M14 family zinc carboxypeptidase [Candidatus Hydrothermia bacterium]
MLKKFLHLLIFLLLMVPSRLLAEKVLELPLTRAQWESLSVHFPKAEFSRYTDKGIAVLVEDEDLRIFEELKIPYKILEDLTLKKKLYYTGKTQYHTYDQMKSEIISLAQNYSNVCKLDTIGFSVQGRPILCLKISDNPQANEPEPKVRFVGVHHGNEWISAEIPFLYAKYLLENYNSNTQVQNLVNNREIFIIPILNPDGHVAQTRYNANGVDLNRNYGYIKIASGSGPYSEPETRSMHEFSKTKNFNMSLSFHSGAVYVNYIWNYTPVRSADDRYNQLVYYYSQQYGNITGYPITEGYDWYQTTGDLNDYSYGINGDIDWTIELSSSYIPDPSQIDPIFNTNRPAMDLFAKKAGQGISGFVIDSLTGDTIKNVRINILPVDWPIWTDEETGYFFRPLLPGTYTLKFEAPGYYAKTIPGVTVSTDTTTFLSVSLAPRNDLRVSLFKPEVIIINAANSVITSDTFMTHYALGERDNKFFSLGVGGYAVFDLGAEVKSESIYVFEGNDGTSNEGFKLYISSSPYGPWTQIGSVYYGNAVIPATYTFRYVKIEDDGDGSSNLRKCGYDLDAIEIKTKPNLELAAYEVRELNGNGDGVVNPGESGVLRFTLHNNTPSVVMPVFVKPIFSDSFLTFQTDSIQIEQINPGGFASDSMIFITSQNLPYDHTVNMVLEIRTSVYSLQVPISFKLNPRDSTVFAGPDNYGYYAYDSRDTLYTEFEPLNFIDIESIGTLIAAITNQDDATTQLSLPFIFKYYGQNYNQISVCSNGWIAMGSVTSNTMNNRPIPDPTNPPALIATYFTDLDPSANGDIYYYYDAPHHQFVIMWKNVRIWGSTLNTTFEVILRDPAYYPTLTGDGEIIFIYGNAPEHSNLTIGIEKPDHSTGLQCYFNGEYDNSISRLSLNQFIKFTTDTPVVSQTGVIALFPKVNIQSSVIKNSIKLSFSNPAFGKMQLFDATGRLVLEKNIIPTLLELHLDVKHLKRGVYFLKINYPDFKKIYTSKIIKVE